MDEFEKLKKIIGLLMCGFALFGAIVALYFRFVFFAGNNRMFFAHGDIFDWVKGGTSNGPIFYGLLAVAGAILLSSVKLIKS